MMTLARLALALPLIAATSSVLAAQQDEARAAGREVSAFASQDPDYLPRLDAISETGYAARAWPDALLDLVDHGVRPVRAVRAPDLTPAEARGRNTWMFWCGGNERLWDRMAQESYGFMDLLKVLDSRRRGTRWQRAGLVNEPGMRAADTVDEYGLWLDVPDPDARGAEPEVDKEIYGRSSGVVGLRLFPNPNFEAFRDEWNANRDESGVATRFYEDPDFFQRRDLVRPYRVGMSCAFCHASAHPLQPPLDPESPKWSNISGSIGSQYLRMRAVFGNQLDSKNFVYHLLDSQLPGTIDTSLIASDNINNPNAMNPIFGVPQRLQRALDNPRAHLAAPSAVLPSVWPAEGKSSYPADRAVPRVLLDGADSIGVYGALARVYLNIGTFSEKWLTLHNPLIGLVPQRPFRIADCEADSVYWKATRERIPDLIRYFLRITPPMPLLDADGVPNDVVAVERLAHGRRVFAQNCIMCHSSIQPESDYEQILAADGETGFDLKAFLAEHEQVRQRRRAHRDKGAEKGEFWDHDPGRWADRDVSEDYLLWAEQIVEQPWFWRQNYLSTDYRIPARYVGTNSARAMATNAMEGHVWSDFSADSFKKLKSPGAVSFFNPYKRGFDGTRGAVDRYLPRHATPDGVPRGGGGPGFYRPPSLISIWATAPFFHNNSLGLFNNDPSVRGRLAAFDDAVRKLLWPELRLLDPDPKIAAQRAADQGWIWRTSEDSYLKLPAEQIATLVGRLPSVLTGVMQEHPSLIDWIKKWQWAPGLGLLLLSFALLMMRRTRSPISRWRRRLGVGALGLSVVISGLLAFVAGRFGTFEVGLIPAGTPVGLLANLNPDRPEKIRKAVRATVRTLAEIRSKKLSSAAARELLIEQAAPALMEASKCPDFVMDRGHNFRWFEQMSDYDKECLIELLKTL